MCGYIKLHRQLEHWGWYQDSKVLHLFLHLLIKASTTNRIYKGVKLKKRTANNILQAISRTNRAIYSNC